MVGMRPMLATAADPDLGLPTDGQIWAYEVKWDGMRVLVDIHDGEVRLCSRTERDITAAFPELARLGAAHPDALLDGEIVVLADGVPSFAALADRIHISDRRRAEALAAKAPASLIVFDALRLYGVDLTARPWQERREVLERLAPVGGQWQISPVHDDLEALFSATREHGLEGVVAKRRASVYRPGVRNSDWYKLAHRRTQSCVVGGWRPETTSPDRIGALMLGVWSAGLEGRGMQLRFAGRVGSGLVGAGPQADLFRLLKPLTVDTPPFAGVIPREDKAGTTWVEPKVVIEVRHLGRTEGGRLRQPVFRGIRSDVDPDDVHDE